MKIQGCTAVVTGAAQGIGKAICQALAAKGAQVCMLDINLAEVKNSADEFKLIYGAEKILFVQADVSSHEQFKGAFEVAKSTFGRVDIVVNNAGIIDEKCWRRCVDVNLVGAISGTMLGLEYMDKNNGAVVVNIASNVGLLPANFHFFPAYIATKAAVIAHTLSWSANPRRQQEGFRFNVVCPVDVNTAHTERLTQEFLIDAIQEDLDNHKLVEKLE